MNYSYALILLVNLLYFSNTNIFAKETQKTKLIGSSTIHPLVKEASKLFANKNRKEEVSKIVIVKGGGSNFGIEYALNGNGMGMVSRILNDSELDAGAKGYTIALDGIGIILHLKNPIKNLNIGQIKDVLSGKIKNWKDLGGTDKPIKILGPNNNHGTLTSFLNLVDYYEKEILNFKGYKSNRKIIHLMARRSNTDAIGIASLGHILKYGDERVKMPSINGIQPSLENLRNRSYPLIRPLNIVSKGEPTGVNKEFVEFLLSTEFQKKISDFDFIPAKNLETTK
ncbi:MAG: substrate-binding domain-containing protein [Oligoflexales bacterium]